MKGNGAHQRNGSDRRTLSGSFPGTGGDQWHRALTGRQAPEPVSAKLRMIYGNVVAEALPDDMLDLLAQLEQKAPDRG
ncbi:MAG: hypothetical protein JNL35_10740 [Sphingopyxis sp.]|nr:hypothetical protein [Sphingopyxis sp.]